jgi:hypothetical protein
MAHMKQAPQPGDSRVRRLALRRLLLTPDNASRSRDSASHLRAALEVQKDV